MTERAKSVIVNSPYSEPGKYLQYHEQDSEREAGFRVVEGRRPSGFWVEREGRNRGEVFEELAAVNTLRGKVRAWREAGYPEATGVTRELLGHWHDRDARSDRPFFFCQLEAIETLIYLAETRDGEIMSRVIPNDGGNFRRLCTKLCTGGGKTVVMSMLIAWQVCNAVSYPRANFTKNVLIVAPNLTVRTRLEVLKPREESNYYDDFSVVPSGMRRMLNQANVAVTNWQAMQEQKPDEKCVVKLPEKKNETFCREIVGRMRNILVINDEAHHAYRTKPGDKKAKTREEKAELETATVWMRGLDRIAETRGIMRCYDFSATPFVPGRGKNDKDSVFEWIVSDFSLDDGIESGIVKTPMIPIHDNATIDPQTGRSRLYHIYRYVKEDLNRKTGEESLLPDLVSQAYMLLGHDWEETFNEWMNDGSPIPPVMISVANTTTTAARLEYAFTKGGLSDVRELCEGEHLVRIDSDKLKDSDTKAEELREKVSTTGKQGEPGGQLRNIISVGMLSEGWDARNVTHIMGLRAFTSQLLCEQVVGRGLRRTSYEPVKDGELFPAEYVSVFGVPFKYLLMEEHGPTTEIPRKPLQEVRALDERKDYAITWPEVEGISCVLRQKLTLDANSLPPLTLNAEGVIINAELSPVLNGKTDPMMIDDIDLEAFYSQRRMQTLMFQTAAKVYDEMRANTQWLKDSNKLYILGQIVKLTEDYIYSGRIKIAPALFETDIQRRKILLCMNMDRVIKHMWQGIKSSNYEELIPLFAQGRRERSTGEMVSWWTSRPAYTTRKSHINLCVNDSTWEDSAAYALDRNPNVAAWAKNDHLGFSIRYVYRGVTRRYLPDFLVRLTNGRTLILEVKGQMTEQDEAKRAALREWVEAVNNHKLYGEWMCDVSESPAEVDGVIARYV